MSGEHEPGSNEWAIAESNALKAKLKDYGIECLVVLHNSDPIAETGITFHTREMHLATAIGSLAITQAVLLKEAVEDKL